MPFPAAKIKQQIYRNRNQARCRKKPFISIAFRGNIDFIGDMGSVVDCHEWVAPHFPILLNPQLPALQSLIRRWTGPQALALNGW